MATRIYLGSTAQVHAFAADGTIFTSFGSGTRYLGQAGLRPPSGPVTKAVAEVSALRNNTLLGMFCVQNLAEQTITGTVKGQIRALESVVAADLHLMCNIRVVSMYGDERGVLFSNTNGGTTISGTPGDENYELDTVATNRKLPPGWTGSGHSVSSVDAENGDALIISVGYRSINTVTTSYTGSILVGSDSASTDLSEDETETADYHPWIEFSHNITFLTNPSKPASERYFLVSQPAAPRSGQTWPRGTGRQ